MGPTSRIGMDWPELFVDSSSFGAVSYTHLNSRYDANVISLYGGFIRNNLFAALTEEGCESNLYGRCV